MMRDSPVTITIIGAGPAGASAAIAAAATGACVTLIDKAVFPRDKICGCCLNRAGVAVLDRLGVTVGGDELNRLHLACGGRAADVALRHGRAISRHALDTALIDRAVTRGVRFIEGVTARVVSPGGVEAGDEVSEADVVIVADGLKGQAAASDETVRPTSRIGVGAIVESDADYRPGTIHMACGEGGYVGVVRVEDGRLNIAAAFDAAFIRAAGEPGEAVRRTLNAAGMPAIAFDDSVRWRGTPALTRSRRSVAGERLLVVGDSAGYVEPFTGEGMAWALAGGAAAGALAGRGWRADTAATWRRTHRAMIGRRQRTCRAVAAVLRRPWLTGLAVDVLRGMPIAARLISGRLNRAFEAGPLPVNLRGATA